MIGEAEDGASAIAAARELAPDVLLLDVQLPDLDGFAVCRECCLNGGPPAVVLVSSRDACDYGGLIEQSGARGFIAKAELSGAALADLLGLSARASRSRRPPRSALALAAIAVLLVLASDHEDNKAATIALAVTAGRLLHRQRPRRALAPAREPHRLPARGRRLPLVLRRADRVEQRLGLHDRRCAQQPRLRRLHPPAARVPRRPARPDAAIAGWSSRRTCSCSPGDVATAAARRGSRPRELPGLPKHDRGREQRRPRIRPRRHRDGARPRDPGHACSSSSSAATCVRRGRCGARSARCSAPARSRCWCSRSRSSSTRTRRGAAQPLEYVFLAAFAMVPLAFLVGVLRSRLARSGVGDLLLALGRGTPIRDALASALADPTLEIAYWLPERERYVSADGKPLPDEPAGRAVTLVEHAGRPTAALLHDPLLADEPELVDAVAAAAGLWLDNERLQAKLRAQIEFLEAIVNASPSLLCSLDREGRIANLNDAAWQASGYVEENDVKGQPFWDVFVGDRRRETSGAAGSRRRRPPTRRPASSTRSSTSVGERLTIAWSTAPLYDDDGRRPLCRLRRPRHHRAQAAGVRAGAGARLPAHARRRHSEPARRRRPRWDGRRQLGQQGLRAHDRLDGAGDARAQLPQPLPGRRRL